MLGSNGRRIRMRILWPWYSFILKRRWILRIGVGRCFILANKVVFRVALGCRISFVVWLGGWVVGGYSDWLLLTLRIFVLVFYFTMRIEAARYPESSYIPVPSTPLSRPVLALSFATTGISIWHFSVLDWYTPNNWAPKAALPQAGERVPFMDINADDRGQSRTTPAIHSTAIEQYSADATKCGEAPQIVDWMINTVSILPIE